METVNIVSYISLALAVIFWILSGLQAKDARKVLDEIKTAMLSWQADLNKASFDIMSSRPEIIAKQTSLEESKSKSESLKTLLTIIKDLSTSPHSSSEENKFRLEALEKLSNHHYGLIISKEKLIHAAAIRSIQPPQGPKEDQNKKGH